MSMEPHVYGTSCLWNLMSIEPMSIEPHVYRTSCLWNLMSIEPHVYRT